MAPPSLAGYLAQLFALTGWTSFFRLAAIAQPTLVLAGEDDPLILPINARILASGIPRARLRFFTDGAALAYELRRLSSIEERLGNMEAAIGDIERAFSIDPDDATLIDELDRLLGLSGKDDERISLFYAEAQRTEDGTKRTRALTRAAELAERLGRHDEAIRHLRAAWIASPGDAEVLDRLSRLTSPTPTEWRARNSNRKKSWNAPESRARQLSARIRARGTPSTKIAPLVGSYSFASSFTSVVLPAPFSPTTATTEPAGKKRSTSSRTSRLVPG